MRTAEFHLEGRVLTAGLSKIDRAKIYGWSDLETVDENDSPCTIATLVDGRHVLPSGSVSMVKLDSKGEKVNTSDLVGMTAEGQSVEKYPGVFTGPVQLHTGNLDDYFAMAVKAVYVLEFEGENPLAADLADGKLLQFKFNYREDYEADDAFLIANGLGVYCVTGQISELEFLAQSQPESPVEEEADDTEELMDFSMF